MEEVTPAEAGKGKRWRSCLGHLALLGSLLFFSGWLLLGYGGMLEAPLRLAVGWAFHGWTMLPPLLPRGTELLLPLACLALALWLGHRFIHWWLVAKGSATVWNPKQTLAAGLLLLLGAAAAIAMSGIIHQVVWLGGETWFENRGKYFNHGRNARYQADEILHALRSYHARECRYPESLTQLALPPHRLFMRASADGMPEPFTYLKPAAEPVARTTVPLVVAPVLAYHDTVVVGYSSGEIRTIRLADFYRLLDASRSQAPADHD